MAKLKECTKCTCTCSQCCCKSSMDQVRRLSEQSTVKANGGGDFVERRPFAIACEWDQKQTQQFSDDGTNTFFCAVDNSPSEDGSVIIKEDGKMFRVSMADEKYVVASSSHTGSIVLRRISVPSENTTEQTNQESKGQANVSHHQDPSTDPPPMPCEPTVIDLTSSDEDESISFPVETNSKPPSDDGNGDGGDVQSTSKASSPLGDHFDLCLDISTESTESCDMDQDHVTGTADSSPDDDQLENSKKDSNIDGCVSKAELSESTKDSDNIELIDKTPDGNHKEDTINTTSTIDIQIPANHELSSNVVQYNTKEDPDINADGNRSTEVLTTVNCDVNDDKKLEISEDEDFKVNSKDQGSQGNSNHDDDKVRTQSEHGNEDNDLDGNHDNIKVEAANEKEVGNGDQELNMDVDEEKDEPSSSASSDENVPPLMSADDLSKLAAQLHQPNEEPPKLTKMECGIRLTDLKDTITKLQSRGVAIDGVSPETVLDSTPSFEDLPLFPESSTCDVDSFPPSPASTDSDSSVTDSLEKSSEASFNRNVRVKSNSSGRRARRFIVTLQKNGIKRCASPDVSGDGPVKKQTTRSLFGEEHCYVIDAKAFGNCGRYLNHSFSPNLFVQNVFIDTHDLRFPRVAFFAQHNISAGSELTWDYMYEVGSVQDKVLRCYCGSSQCRGRLL